MSQFLAVLSAFLFVLACSVDTQYSGGEEANAAYKSKDSKVDKKKSNNKKKKSSSDLEDEEESEEEMEDHEHTEMPAGTSKPTPTPTVAPSPSASASPAPAASPSPSATPVLGLKNVGLDPTDPTMTTAVFVIKAGTGTGAYNSLDTMIEIDRTLSKVNKLKLVNMDNVNHILHTGGAPCGHQNTNAPTPPGGSYICNLNQVIDPGANQPATYNHLSTRANSPLFLKVIN